jgi:hypothetical protein
MNESTNDGVTYRQIETMHTYNNCNGLMVPQFLYMTSNESLYIGGYCSRCSASIGRELSIAELKARCPGKPAEQPVSDVADVTTDADFMKVMGITDPPDNPAR